MGFSIYGDVDDDLPKFTELILLYLTFLPLFFGIIIVQKFWHKRSFTSLLTATRTFRWGFFTRAIIAAIIVYIISLIISALFFPENLKELKLNPDMSLVIKGALLTLLFVPFQAASEEFLLRGYLNQALIKYLRSPWLVFFVTSIGFALLHISNPEADGQQLPYLSIVFIFGFAACVLLYLEGGLESALGLHIINNIVAFAIIGYEDPLLPETALFNSGPPELDWESVGWEIATLFAIVVLTIWLNRRFGPAPTLKND